MTRLLFSEPKVLPVSVPAVAAPRQEPVPEALGLRGLMKSYKGTLAVRGVDLSVAQGEFVTILGPSGSGKTTVLRLISGFLEPSEGAIFLQGKDVSRMSPAERGIGMVFQSYALFPHLTVAENIAYPLRLRKWAKKDVAARVAEMISLIGLDHLGDRLPRQLSGGQQQRVALARALAFRPGLLLMDEPLGALDRALRVRMAGEIRRIHQEFGVTVVYVTHDREEALALSDRIAIMHDGVIEAINTPRDLFTRPQSRFVATFFGGHAILPAAIRAATIGTMPDHGSVLVEALGQQLRVPAGTSLAAGDSACLAIPERAITLTGRPAQGDLRLRGVIRDVMYLGDVVQVSFSVHDADGKAVLLQASLPGEQDVAMTAGETATFSVKPEAIVAVSA
jgi:ABC-type Fe3+/spermidine/putrescine transport system ATPase subunit